MADAARKPLHVLFVAAAGPSIGFGHLVRCGHLASALDVTPMIVLRAGPDAVWTAVRFGWTIFQGSPDALLAAEPDLVIVDDPSVGEVRRWVRAARRRFVPVVTIHDGAGARVPADLEIDGSLTAEVDAPRAGRGVRWALLDARVATLRRRAARRRRRHVLIALGGGRHVHQLGARIATDLSRRMPGLQIEIAAGFVDVGTRPELGATSRWISAPDGLAQALARATVAIVGGGVTLYEACALGTPVVAVPVVKGQQPAVRAAVSLGVAVRATPAQAAARAATLLAHPDRARAQARRAARLIDAQGAMRIADAVRALVLRWRIGSVHHAA